MNLYAIIGGGLMVASLMQMSYLFGYLKRANDEIKYGAYDSWHDEQSES